MTGSPFMPSPPTAAQHTQSRTLTFARSRAGASIIAERFGLDEIDFTLCAWADAVKIVGRLRCGHVIIGRLEVPAWYLLPADWIGALDTAVANAERTCTCMERSAVGCAP